MTDLIPNDLSHMSDEDFNALCPQGEHAPGHEPLSPAAQAVLDAYCTEADLRNREVTDCEMLAAALRATADQVVPPALEEEFYDRNQAPPLTAMVKIRQKLLAIAAELESKGNG